MVLQIHLKMVAALSFLLALLYLIGVNNRYLPFRSLIWFIHVLMVVPKSSHRAVRSAELGLASRYHQEKPGFLVWVVSGFAHKFRTAIKGNPRSPRLWDSCRYLGQTPVPEVHSVFLQRPWLQGRPSCR